MATESPILKLAILDMYEGHANQGMRCIREIIKAFSDTESIDIQIQEFDVRRLMQVPDLSFDIYISTGGPGSPLDTLNSEWERLFFNWLQQLEDFNADEFNPVKKHVFFICHSFQLVCRHWQLGNVCKRKSTSFGVFPIHMINGAQNEEPVFDQMNDPFYVVDSRDFQVIEPNHEELARRDAHILCIEKERPHVALERAVMGIRFNPYMVGTQFHPEADAIGMSMYLQTEDRKKIVIETHGQEKWQSMIEQLNDPDKILFTYNHILPNFLQEALEQHRQLTALDAEEKMETVRF